MLLLLFRNTDIYSKLDIVLLLIWTKNIFWGHDDSSGGKESTSDTKSDAENPEIVSGLSPGEEKDKITELMKKIQ